MRIPTVSDLVARGAESVVGSAPYGEASCQGGADRARPRGGVARARLQHLAAVRHERTAARCGEHDLTVRERHRACAEGHHTCARRDRARTAAQRAHATAQPHTPRATPKSAAAKAKPTVAKKAAAKKKTVSDPTPGARPPPSSRSGARGRFARQHALSDVRAALHATGGATVYELAERLGVSVRTVIRYLQALEETGEGLYDEREGHKKIWRLAAGGRTSVLHLTTSQMTALYLSRKVVGFLEGTGFSEDLEEVFHKLELTLKRRDFAATQKLGKKLFSVNEAPHIYAGRDEHVNAILTALTREERLLAQHESVGRGQARFRIDPYTLLVYKKGLYLAGLSDHHGAIRHLLARRLPAARVAQERALRLPRRLLARAAGRGHLRPHRRRAHAGAHRVLRRASRAMCGGASGTPRRRSSSRRAEAWCSSWRCAAPWSW
jgi:predicted DNA-binding transcriptional regulator YafY